jgi:putative SOS response-associated peptidase YedK
MCYWVGTYGVRESLKKSVIDNTSNLFSQDFKHSIERFYGFDFQEKHINIARAKNKLTIIKKESEGQYTFDNYTWSLRWNYIKDGKLIEGNPLPNIRDNKVAWRHRELVGKNNCILPIMGYVEYHHSKGETYPFFIYSKNKEPLFIAGIYNDFVDEQGQIHKTFGLITTTPNERVSKIHNRPDAEGPRMLLIIPSERIEEYLDPIAGRNIKNFSKPYPEDQLQDHTIMRFLRKENAHLLNSQTIIDPFYYPELEEEGILK